jgi:WD40 repeat protein
MDIVAGPFEGHTHDVMSVAFSPDGTRNIVSGSRDRTIQVWDARSGDVVTRPFEGHIDYVMSVAFSPNGTCIVSGSEDHTIRVWDVPSGDVVAGLSD